jgi:starvation-inducible DNA-binding protein
MNKLNTYIANLAVLNVKFHNMHWNLVGKQFVQLHQFTEEAYDAFFEQYDTVAELLKMRGMYPLGSVAEYLQHASVKELPSQDITGDEVLRILKEDYSLMLHLATEIRNEADAENDFTVVAVFESYVAAFQKNLWFIKAIQG